VHISARLLSRRRGDHEIGHLQATSSDDDDDDDDDDV